MLRWMQKEERMDCRALRTGHLNIDYQYPGLLNSKQVATCIVPGALPGVEAAVGFVEDGVAAIWTWRLEADERRASHGRARRSSSCAR